MSSSHYLYSVLCPAHQDHQASAAVYDDGHLHCFVCGYHKDGAMPPRPSRKQRYQGPLPWSMVEEYQKLLWGPFHWRMGWFWGRGLRPLTVEKLHFGHTGQAFVIPVWDDTGRLITIRYRRDDRLVPGEDGPKYRGLAGATRTLYGLWQPLAERVVVLTEGELDAALLMQEFWRHNLEHLVALSVTSGAGSFNEELARLVVDAKGVVVAYDQDEPGREGARRACQLLDQAGVYAGYASWPECWGKDVTDAIATQGSGRFIEHVAGRWI